MPPPSSSSTTTSSKAAALIVTAAAAAAAAVMAICWAYYDHHRRAAAAAPFRRLSKAEKRAAKYEKAKQRIRDMSRKLHRKQADKYKALSDEERAKIKAWLVARDAEREARLGAVLQVDAPFVQHQQATLSSSQEEEQQQPPPLAPHLRLCVDLGYGDEIHGERGTRSLGQQLGWIWNAMKLASSERETPVLHLVSYEGKTARVLESMGLGNWPIYRHPQALAELFPKESIVYLSPDAEEVLEELDLTKVYVIGGIVDRTIVRGVTVKAAGSLGVRTARLPLEHLNLKKRKAHRVLNIDTVAKALMAFHATGNWAEALGQCLPKRHVSETSKTERRKARWAAAAAAEAGGAGAVEEGGEDEEGGEEGEEEERKV